MNFHLQQRTVLAVLLGLITLGWPVAGRADMTTQNENAAYQAALPLYKDDAKAPLAVTSESPTPEGSGRVIHFSYAGDGGERVPAVLFLPPGADATHPVPCLVALHGLGGSKEDMTGLALYALGLGDATFAIDEYGQGARTHVTLAPGRVGLTTIATGIQHTVVDVRRGLDYLDTRPDIAHGRIGLLGVSLGAIIGTISAGVDPRLKAVVLVSGGGDWALILKTLADEHATIGGQSAQSLQGVDWTVIGMLLSAYDPVTFAPFIAPRPVLMEHGRLDTVIVPASAQALYDAASHPANAHVHLDWFANSGHVPAPELITPNIERFLTKNL